MKKYESPKAFLTELHTAEDIVTLSNAEVAFNGQDIDTLDWWANN